VVFDTEPTADVTIAVSSDDLTEGTGLGRVPVLHHPQLNFARP